MIKKRILIIDDEVNFCKLVKQNLELTGEFEVETAANGKKGVALAEKIRPDLILMDIMMPEMDGFGALEKLKENMKTISIPVVMLTAKGDEISKVKAAKLYDEEYITKPIDTIDLKNKIDEVLKRTKK